jgi:hypothetical protein
MTTDRASLTAPELDAFLRDHIALLEAQRRGAARLRRREQWDEARAAFTAAVADKTGVDAAFVAELLDRRELAREPGHASCWPAQRELADSLFAASVMAAAWMAAAGRTARPRTGKG